MDLHVAGVLYTKVTVSNRVSLRVRSWNMHMHAITPVTLEMLQGMNPEWTTRIVVERVHGDHVDLRLQMVMPTGEVGFASDIVTLTETDSVSIGRAEIKFST